VGGGAKSEIWCQILADVLGRSVHVVAAPGDAAARGAAIIAGVGLGWYADYCPAGDFFAVNHIYTPETKSTKLYDELYPVFRKLYPQLRGVFQDLADMTARID
jgi:xylulokinase